MSIKLTGLRHFSRRDFMKIIPLVVFGILALGFGLFKFFSPKIAQKFKGKIQGANAKIGHMMRMGKFPEATHSEEIETVIVGAGMAGLSAGWWLGKNEHKNFVILELDDKAGGNSRSGENQVSAYPWAAHYLPLPGPEAVYVRDLLEELRVIIGYQNDLPIFDDFYLCSDPHDRLFFQGKWHKGLFPEPASEDFAPSSLIV